MFDDVRLSKKLSFWLRHRPEAAALVLDEHGWAEIDLVLAALRQADISCGPARLKEIVAGNDKQRFELSLDGSHIRARQGHSVAVDLALPARVPPELLYHGTVGRSLAAILAQGLKPMRRHHVHLSPDIVTARLVGARRGAPVVLAVRALELHACGTPFYLTENGVWLTCAVPAGFLEVAKAPSGDAEMARS